MHACLLIPAYQPNEALLGLVNEVIALASSSSKIDLEIIVVNDGSISDKSKKVFDLIKLQVAEVHLLELAENGGKGGALKAGFAYITAHMTDVTWVVTADADGQHLSNDVWRILNAGLTSKKPVLGVREFDPEMPLRSYVGNVLTRRLFSLIHGLDISDTQTGLRGFGYEWVLKLQAIPFKGYDFEIEALSQMAKTDELLQIPIERVYEPGNPTSHFRPLHDSFRIYAVLFRHIFVVFLATVFEFALYSSLVTAGTPIFSALLIGRTLATVILFWFARNYVFKSNGNYISQVGLYILLVGINLLLLWLLIIGLNQFLGVNYILGMAIGYCSLFIFNFFIQRYIVFKDK